MSLVRAAVVLLLILSAEPERWSGAQHWVTVGGSSGSLAPAPGPTTHSFLRFSDQ